jgi:hypothetical protein
MRKQKETGNSYAMPHKLDINIESAQTTIIPRKIFNPEWSQDLVELNFEFDPKNQVILSEVCRDIVFLSVIDKNMHDLALSKFPASKFYSTYRLLFQIFERATRSDKRNRHQIFANITPNSFDLFVFEKHRLIYANTFIYQSSSDFLYYLLHATNRLRIDTGGLPLKIVDSTAVSSELIDILESHFSSIVKLSGRENPQNLRLPIQPGISLINSALCE